MTDLELIEGNQEILPSLLSFITLRPERFGAIVFNPFLGMEQELDPIETFIAGLCNGLNSQRQIETAAKRRFNRSINDTSRRITETFNKLTQIYALTFANGMEQARPRLPDTAVFSEEGPYLSAPKNVIWDVTYACNLSCPHCLTSSKKAMQNELNTRQAISLIEELANNRILYLSLSGGEPFLRPDLIDLIRHISLTNMRLDIATNGFHLPENILRALRDLPVFQIQVSIDGIEEQHDQFRGKEGSFAAASRTIQRLRDEGIVVGLSTTVNSQNVKDFERIIDFALEVGCSGFKAIPFLPAGRGRKNARSLMIDAEGYLRLCRILVKRSEELKGTLKISTETTYPFLLEQAPQGAPENGHIACSAGYDTLSIGADGTVYPCPFLRDFPLGNLLECSLSPLWKQDPILNTLRTLEKKDMWEPCKSCDYCQTTCRGGCRAAAYLVHGDFRACDPTCFKSIVEHSRIH